MNLSRPTVLSAPRRRAGARAILAAGVVLAFAVSAFAQAQSADPVLAKVNGVEIRQSDLAIAEEDVGSNLPQQSTPEQKQEFLLNYLIDVTLISKAAEAKKLGDSTDFKRRLALARNKVLMEMLMHAEAKGAVNDAAMHKVYDEAVKQMGDQQEVRARHILVEKEDDAKAILADLKKGADFAELAKTKSKDPGASAEGGDLGYFTKDQMVPEFAEVAFKLDKGQLSDPVKTQFGWHIIKVEDKRARAAPEFDKVKDQIETFVMRKAQADLITKLRTDGKVERLDKKPDAPAPAAAPAPAGDKKK